MKRAGSSGIRLGDVNRDRFAVFRWRALVRANCACLVTHGLSASGRELFAPKQPAATASTVAMEKPQLTAKRRNAMITIKRTSGL